MSWSFAYRGSKSDVQKQLDEQAPVTLQHVEGVERTLADQGLGLARAAVAANEDNAQYEVSAAGSGSAVFAMVDGVTKQVGQSIHIVVQSQYKQK